MCTCARPLGGGPSALFRRPFEGFRGPLDAEVHVSPHSTASGRVSLNACCPDPQGISPPPLCQPYYFWQGTASLEASVLLQRGRCSPQILSLRLLPHPRRFSVSAWGPGLLGGSRFQGLWVWSRRTHRLWSQALAAWFSGQASVSCWMVPGSPAVW